ncbi:ubiquitin carboxyl-terminal hydrolase 12-like [Juglans regia]|uniref:Ubiquitin carboxyl-terminal hydrolase 12-like n=1 Tax=Juglans regia TaxID=51240 RepID=A0A6P9ER66_JUGRE|nr:ubiquitin carboxyl-terminal hydrolase 12-like [Juglans regia]
MPSRIPIPLLPQPTPPRTTPHHATATSPRQPLPNPHSQVQVPPDEIEAIPSLRSPSQTQTKTNEALPSLRSLSQTKTTEALNPHSPRRGPNPTQFPCSAQPLLDEGHRSPQSSLTQTKPEAPHPHSPFSVKPEAPYPHSSFSANSPHPVPSVPETLEDCSSLPHPLQEEEEMLVPHSDLVEGPQPMEVVTQVEPSSTVENQQVEDPPSLKFTWTIENFSRLNTKKHYSEVFVVGGYKWRILVFPKGNNVDHLSMYLDVANSTTLPYGWSRYAQFSLGVLNQAHSKYSIRKDTQHQFNARESDWGFTSFMPLSDLYDPSRGYLVNDSCIVEAEVAVRKVLDYWSYDSKKETGYVGLKNQGATRYMNSLLQTLYHIPYFRKAVYHMPTTENDMPSGSIPLALQSLFYKLQYNDSSVATKELTKSFGWDTYDSFMQHDVQELNRVLCEKLEDKMKGTVVEGTIQQLFEGHHMNYIECINVDYKSTRKESFYDLQLDVKGCRDDIKISPSKVVEYFVLQTLKPTVASN